MLFVKFYKEQMKKTNNEPVVQPTTGTVVNDKTEDQVALLKKELGEKNNLYLRAVADYQNLDRRLHEEKERAVETAQKSLLIDFLSLKDDIDRTIEFGREKENREPMKLIKQKCDITLKKYGVTEIDALHKEFTPHEMECIDLVPGEKANVVVKIHEKGYLFNNKLLRPARVAVSQLTVSK